MMRARPTHHGDGYLPTLDGWRSVAVLAVIACHALDGVFAAGSRIHALSRHGALGVDIFFGLSGFVVSYRLLREWNLRGRISLGGFYVRRTFRILPPYLAYLSLLMLLAEPLEVTARELLSCFGFFRNYLPMHAGAGWYTGHFWSLAIEEHFYALMPILLISLGVARARWIIPILALAIGLWRAAEFRVQALASFVPGVAFYERTDLRLDGLLWGCALSLVFVGLREHLVRWTSRTFGGLVASAFVCCVVYQPPLAMLLQAVLIAVMIGATVLHHESTIGRLLESAPMRWLGRLSYSLYVWQQLFLVSALVPRSLGPLQEWPWNLVATFACAMASYHFLERPMIELGHRIAATVTARTVRA